MADLDKVFVSGVESAVSASVSQNKPLIVFITDSKETSEAWVQALITEDTLEQIQEKAVALKLVKDSVQCGLFEQIFPNVIAPSLYCIRVAAILDVIYGDITKEAFDIRLEKVLEPRTVSTTAVDSTSSTPSAAGATTTSTSAANTTSATAFADQRQQSQFTGHDTAQTPQTHQPESSSSIPTQTPQDQITPAKSSAQVAARKSKQYKSLKEEAAELASEKYKEEQLRKRRVENEERLRVRRLLKADEQERRLAVEERERQRKFSDLDEAAEKEHSGEATNKQQNLKDNVHQKKRALNIKCALLIRLLDGSSLAHDFKSTDTLNDVRAWLDQNRTDNNEPYCFHRTIPRVTFGVTDEERTLESLELTPRSALILKSFKNYANAQNQSSNSRNAGFLSRVMGGITSFWGGNESTSTNSATSTNHTVGNVRSDHSDEFFEAASPGSSFYVSPVHSPSILSDSEPNALDLTHPSTMSLNLHHDDPLPQAPSLQLQNSHSRVNSPDILAQVRDNNQYRIKTLSSSENDEQTVYYNREDGANL